MKTKLEKHDVPVFLISGTYKLYDETKLNDIFSRQNPSPKELKQSFSKEEPARTQWRCRREFLFTSIAGCLGSANLWTFPFVAKKYGGGGAFFVAYLLLTVAFAMPMCLVESILPQFSGKGTISVWNLAPIAKGIGISQLLLIVLTIPSNCVLLAYNIFYIASSFANALPWSTCSYWWGAGPQCAHYHMWKTNWNNSSLGSSELNFSSLNSSRVSDLPTKEFLEKYVLKKDGSEDISHIGEIQWQLFLCLLFTWVIIFLCISKGIRSVGHIVTYTVPFVYLALFLLMIRLSVIDGGLDGISYFFDTNWSSLIDINLWVSVAQQLIFALGVTSGAKAAFASHNVFHHKIQIDAWILWAATTIANIMMSITIYAIIGAMAKILEVPIEEIAISESFKLSYIIYPEVIAETLKIPQFWSCLFYFTQFVMRIVFQFIMVLVIYIGVQDVWPSMRKRQTLWIFGICCILFFISLPSVTNGGYYVTKLINDYTHVWVGFIVLLCEVVAVCAIYDFRRFMKDMIRMTGILPFLIFKISWSCLSFIIVSTVIAMYFINLSESNVGDGDDNNQVTTMWAIVVGWLLPCICLLPIPCVAVFYLIKSLIKKDISAAFKPTSQWKPNLEQRLYWTEPEPN